MRTPIQCHNLTRLQSVFMSAIAFLGVFAPSLFGPSCPRPISQWTVTATSPACLSPGQCSLAVADRRTCEGVQIPSTQLLSGGVARSPVGLGRLCQVERDW